MVNAAPHTIGYMSKLTEKEKFASRLHELCDDNGLPPKGKGRQQALKDHYKSTLKISQVTAFKWLNGKAIPEMDKCIFIAKDWKVNFEWLMSGRGVKAYQETAADYSPLVMNLAKWLANFPEERLALLAEMMNQAPVADDKLSAAWRSPSSQPSSVVKEAENLGKKQREQGARDKAAK